MGYKKIGILYRESQQLLLEGYTRLRKEFRQCENESHKAQAKYIESTKAISKNIKQCKANYDKLYSRYALLQHDYDILKAKMPKKYKKPQRIFVLDRYNILGDPIHKEQHQLLLNPKDTTIIPVHVKKMHTELVRLQSQRNLNETAYNSAKHAEN